MAVTRNGFICYGLTGGGTGALDAKVSTDIIGVAFAITVDSGKVYFHYYDSSSALAESSPDVIKPDDLGVGDAGRWLLLDVWTGLAALDALGALTPAANKIPHFTSASAATALEITANTIPGRSSAGNIAAKACTDFAFSLLDDADAATLIATIGTNVIPYTSLTSTAKDKMVKGWVSFGGAAGTINGTGYNVDSITDNGAGDFTVVWDTDFADDDYAIVGTSSADAGATTLFVQLHTIAAGSTRVLTVKRSDGSAADPIICCIMAIGAQ